MRPILGLTAIVFAFGCSGEIVGTVTTDFGDAVATSERAESGDVSAWLAAVENSETLGQLNWSAETGEIDAVIADQTIPFEGTISAMDASLEDINLMLYTFWEVERSQPEEVVCMGNDVALCCRDASWKCTAN